MTIESGEVLAWLSVWIDGADLHMAQLTPLPLTVSCFSKIQISFTFLVPAHPGSPRQRAVQRVCVCVCVYVCDYRDERADPVLRAGSGCGWTCVGDELSSRRRSSFDDDDQSDLLHTHTHVHTRTRIRTNP